MGLTIATLRYESTVIYQGVRDMYIINFAMKGRHVCTVIRVQTSSKKKVSTAWYATNYSCVSHSSLIDMASTAVCRYHDTICL